MLKLTLTDAMATRYNEETEDWSGKEYSMYSEQLTATGTNLKDIFVELFDTYFWGIGIDYADLLNNMKENADGNTTAISYTGDDFGNYDNAGNYLIDLFFKVETVEPADVATLLN
jgi:hypothetical protein